MNDINFFNIIMSQLARDYLLDGINIILNADENFVLNIFDCFYNGVIRKIEDIQSIPTKERLEELGINNDILIDLSHKCNRLDNIYCELTKITI